MKSAETTVGTVRVPPDRWRRAGVGLALFALLAAAAVVQRAAILTWIGSLLVVEDDLIRAEIVLPLTGGDWDREIEAADLFRAGYARTVLLTLEPEGTTRDYLMQRGIDLPTAEELRVKVLMALGVPPDRIVVIRQPVTSTLDEARAVGAWMAGSGARTLIIVSSPYHTARAKYIFDRYAATGGTRLVVRPTTLNPFRADSWWKSRVLLREGIFELEKLVAYRLRY